MTCIVAQFNLPLPVELRYVCLVHLFWSRDGVPGTEYRQQGENFNHSLFAEKSIKLKFVSIQTYQEQ